MQTTALENELTIGLAQEYRTLQALAAKFVDHGLRLRFQFRAVWW